jgi:hypothetical protein
MEHGAWSMAWCFGSANFRRIAFALQWAGVKLEGQTPERTGRAGKARSQAGQP